MKGSRPLLFIIVSNFYFQQILYEFKRLTALDITSTLRENIKVNTEAILKLANDEEYLVPIDGESTEDREGQSILISMVFVITFQLRLKHITSF